MGSILESNLDLGVIQSQLFGYYGKLIPNDTQESQEYLIYYLTDLVNTFDTEKQLAARALLAKISLLSGAYDAAIQECQYILNTNTFVLDHKLSTILKVKKLFGEDIKKISAIRKILAEAISIRYCCVKSTLWLPSLILKPEEKWKSQKLKTS